MAHPLAATFAFGIIVGAFLTGWRLKHPWALKIVSYVKQRVKA